jgi:succinate-semialdehyde dehydrogenase/glutarate-semialdehyde dehydrogenase
LGLYSDQYPKKSEEYAMNPPVAARASQSSPSLRDRLKDPSLLREQCYIDGAWTGKASRPVTNPVNGI